MKTIEFSIPMVERLRNNYQNVMDFCSDDFPSVNLDSTVQVKSFFREKFSLVLPDTKISTVQFLWSQSFDGTEKQDYLFAFLTYLRAKYTMRNYINCILKHEKGGIITLREIDGELLMPNKRPISYNEEITDCIVNSCDEIKEHIAKSKQLQHNSVL